VGHGVDPPEDAMGGGRRRGRAPFVVGARVGNAVGEDQSRGLSGISFAWPPLPRSR
jgi:hypothetical protein